MAEPVVVGWDIGGAHVKAARLAGGRVQDVAQWPCPLWQGTEHLEHGLAQAAARWPGLARARHAVTMTGEMVDLFAHREDGVRRIAALMARAVPAPRFFAGDAGWCGADTAATHWPHIASANWLAAARHCARALPDMAGMLVDIGSTTTDLIAFEAGRVPTPSRSDVQRLASGELVYQGVVRTPLCALARRIPWRGERLNVMNEFFATTADVYRLTGELAAAHDQQPSADDAPKDAGHTRMRLARMIGLDARDAGEDEWLGFARAWRAQQLGELRGQLDRVLAGRPGSPVPQVLVAAGCGAFLVPELLPPGARALAYGRDVARLADGVPPATADWAAVCAPAVAVAALADEETR
ncbi:MAG: H4MPT-linked C1 transfer pathway protein [Piscinibacter sp.]|nr:H4MPT-linked C1 transfer pathway protein [Piscinibacter sp.]